MTAVFPRRRAFGVCSLLAAAKPSHGHVVAPRADDERQNWWPSLARYSAENALLLQSREKIDCVFIGDSITERWHKLRPEFFPPGRICRGITGQTTPQILVRFRADVVALKPEIVHIMAGTNDIAGNTGSATPELIEANIASMSEIAMASGVRVILASVPPATSYPWKPSIRPIIPTQKLNSRLKAYAARIGAVYADYYTVLDDGKGGMRPGWATGEVHPTEIAYARMEVVTLNALARARDLPRHRLCSA